MKCPTCSRVLELYGTTESVAPWLCTCFNPEPEKKENSKQLNIEGCSCKPRRWKSGRVTAGIYCVCDR